MNALLAPAQSDKKAEIILSDGRFAEVFKTKVYHAVLANADDDMTKLVKLVCLVVRIDDKEITPKDVLNLDLSDFSKIAEAIGKN